MESGLLCSILPRDLCERANERQQLCESTNQGALEIVSLKLVALNILI